MTANNSDNDATKVIYTKVPASKDTVMMPDGAGRGPAGAKVVGVMDIQGGVKVGAHSDPSDKTVFRPAHGDSDQMNIEADPVVGWLVVVDGPGRGQFRPVFYGQNSVGRGEGTRVPIDFGDQRISREPHAFIIYDEIERKFFIKDNGKASIVRLNGNPVLSPTELHNRDSISIGQTTLLFAALCDGTFDWLASNAQKTA